MRGLHHLCHTSYIIRSLVTIPLMLIPFFALFCIAAEISEIVPGLDQMALATGNAANSKEDTKLANSTQLVVNSNPANNSKPIVNGKPANTTQNKQGDPRSKNHDSTKGTTKKPVQQVSKKLPVSKLVSPAKPSNNSLATDSTAPGPSFCWKESYGRGVGTIPGGYLALLD